MLERMTHGGGEKKKEARDLKTGRSEGGRGGEKEEEGRERGSDWGVGRKGEKG